MVKNWSADAREQLRADVPRLGLAATIHGRRLNEVAAEVLHIAARTSQAQPVRRAGSDETLFLDPLDAVLAENKRSRKIDKEIHDENGQEASRPAFEECVLLKPYNLFRQRQC